MSRNRAPRLLMALAGSFYPPVQGDSVRLEQIVRYFRTRGWTVFVAYLESDDHRFADPEGMAARCDALYTYRARRPSDRAGATRPDDQGWCPRGFAELVGRLANRREVDCVFAQYSYLSACFEHLAPTGAVKVLDADNLFSRRRGELAAAGFDYDWFSPSPEEEARLLAQADLVLAVQEAEARAFRQLVPGGSVLLVPPAEPAIATTGQESSNLLFVSTSDPPNDEGIRRFVADALPRVLAAHPGVHLFVVGTVARAVPPHPAVERVGPVADVRPWYNRSAIALNTTVCGTGIKSKTVRALVHGKCLVTTPAGAQGLEAYPDVYVLARSTDEFAERVIELLDDPDRILGLSRRAFAFARSYLSPDAVYGRLERAILDRMESSDRARQRPIGVWARTVRGVGST